MIRILANIEYLLQPENANKTLKNKDISVNNNVRIIELYISIKKKG